MIFTATQIQNTCTTKGHMNHYHSELLISCRITLGARLLHHKIEDGLMTIYYRTRGGYTVAAQYNSNGLWIESNYFQNWNEETKQPSGFLFTRPSN